MVLNVTPVSTNMPTEVGATKLDRGLITALHVESICALVDGYAQASRAFNPDQIERVVKGVLTKLPKAVIKSVVAESAQLRLWHWLDVRNATMGASNLESVMAAIRDEQNLFWMVRKSRMLAVLRDLQGYNERPFGASNDFVVALWDGSDVLMDVSDDGVTLRIYDKNRDLHTTSYLFDK